MKIETQGHYKVKGQGQISDFRPKMVKIPKFDLDLWPWNDLEGKFSFTGNEISLIPNHRWDMTEIW